eukprot:TRINITY_DN43208_c0_g1_i1.p1 TRINITY_DN43208_c0_g1~~TRINITY_DN43208_c0_g1_i1.p1  ORF type:complete len:236 (+),score=18.78 TRINITY_DN43208_c0_g1_i1:79-786(+)
MRALIWFSLLAMVAIGQEDSTTNDAPADTQADSADTSTADTQADSADTSTADGDGEQASSDDEEEEDTSNIIIDSRTPIARFRWLDPGENQWHQFSRPIPTGSNYTLEWTYTEPVVLPPRTMTLFRTRLPFSSAPRLPADWVKMVTFPYKRGQEKVKIMIGRDWIEGKSYYFKLEANYDEDDTRGPAGKIQNGIPSGPMRIYHVDDTFRVASEASAIAGFRCGMVVAIVAGMIFG